MLEQEDLVVDAVEAALRELEDKARSKTEHQKCEKAELLRVTLDMLNLHVLMETSNNIDIYLKYLSLFMPHLSDGKTLSFDMLCFSRNRIVPYYVKPYKNNKSYSTQLKKNAVVLSI